MQAGRDRSPHALIGGAAIDQQVEVARLAVAAVVVDHLLGQRQLRRNRRVADDAGDVLTGGHIDDAVGTDHVERGHVDTGDSRLLVSVARLLADGVDAWRHLMHRVLELADVVDLQLEVAGLERAAPEVVYRFVECDGARRRRWRGVVVGDGAVGDVAGRQGQRVAVEGAGRAGPRRGVVTAGAGLTEHIGLRHRDLGGDTSGAVGRVGAVDDIDATTDDVAVRVKSAIVEIPALSLTTILFSVSVAVVVVGVGVRLQSSSSSSPSSWPS